MLMQSLSTSHARVWFAPQIGVWTQKTTLRSDGGFAFGRTLRFAGHIARSVTIKSASGMQHFELPPEQSFGRSHSQTASAAASWHAERAASPVFAQTPAKVSPPLREIQHDSPNALQRPLPKQSTPTPVGTEHGEPPPSLTAEPSPLPLSLPPPPPLLPPVRTIGSSEMHALSPADVASAARRGTRMERRIILWSLTSRADATRLSLQGGIAHGFTGKQKEGALSGDVQCMTVQGQAVDYGADA
jgi:hypothetical protein